ncbi:MAG: isoprenylcysteine carboxylmethyltransferase family protein [Acidimicrobiia bacterium]|nr:isoprenylcysteine carboxylmethyltransferase family protein [Acidimicrobiia bacterium]
MRRYWFPKHYSDEVQRLRVPSGFVLVAAFTWWAAPSPTSLYAGLPIAILGLLLRAWAAGHLAKNEELAVSGPYAWVRNPLYLGTLLVAAGLAIAAGQIGLAILFGVVFLFVYFPAMELEEQHLRNLFPDYAAYAQRVPMLLPTRRPAVSIRSFRFSLYMRNQEYQALAGLLLGSLYLIWRAGLLPLP